MKVIVLLLANDEDDKDDIYRDNAVDFSFLQKNGNPHNIEIELVYVTMANYEQTIRNFDRESVIINLCDGIDSDGYPGMCVVKLLEELKLTFTGCSSKNYEWRKSDIKKFKVSTPKHVLVTKNSVITEELFAHLTYPLIAKPDYGAGSVGIEANCRVTTYQELEAVLPKLVEDFRDGVMVEEFIEGVEFTILACENYENKQDPIIFEPLACIFTNGYTFKHFFLKWKDFECIKWEIIENSELHDKIVNFCKETFVNCELDGYVRMDLRMNKDGQIFINDINPYCAVFYPPDIYGSADYILTKSKLMDHEKFVHHLFKCAEQRYN